LGENIMNIVIFGASGTVGSHLVQQALEDGQTVTAFGRTPSKLSIDHPDFRFAQGDVVEDPDSVRSAIQGQDVVVVTLGAGMRGRVRSEGTRNIVNAMRDSGVDRIICQSTLGAGDSFANLNLKWKFIFRVPLRGVFVDHQLQEEHVRESALDWTIVRPAAFTDGPRTGEYQHGFSNTTKSINLTVSRADVADFLLRQVDDDRYLHQTVGLSY